MKRWQNCEFSSIFLTKEGLESLYKVTDLRPESLLKKETPTQVLSSEFCEIF